MNNRDTVESVWDYPRPPRLEPTPAHLRVVHRGVTLAETRNGWRVLETSHPPVYYFPPAAVNLDVLRPVPRRASLCEWKGAARYWNAVLPTGVAVSEVGWSYPDPIVAFTPVRDYLAFYAGRVEECTVDGDRVTPQPGGFYGGWITANLRGPFKGGPGTLGW